MSKLETNTIDTVSGSTTLTLGGTNATTIAQDAATTVTGFKSTGLDDNATSTAITIDSGNNVGIGKTSAISGYNLSLGKSTNVSGEFTGITFQESTSNFYGYVRAEDNATPDTSFVIGHTTRGIVFKPGDTERMRIETSGRALLSSTGTNTVTDSSYKFQMRFTGSSDAGLNIVSEANANGTGFIAFHRSSTTGIGSISRNGTADGVNYNTSSDYRLKENVGDMTDATTRLKQLQPKRFSWISQNSDTATQDGFLAHEVSSVVPEAITGTKDAVQVWEEGDELPEGVSVGDNKLDENGNTIPKYQGIDQSKLVPLLVKTIQELEARITQLENA